MTKDKLILKLSSLFSDEITKGTAKNFDRASAFKDSIDVITIPDRPFASQVRSGSRTPMEGVQA